MGEANFVLGHRADLPADDDLVTLLAKVSGPQYYLKFFPFVPTSCHLCSHKVTFSQLLQAMSQGSIFL